MNAIAIPVKTREKLAQLIKERDAIHARIDDVLGTVQDTLGVPDGWYIRNLDEGFIAPEVDAVSTVTE